MHQVGIRLSALLLLALVAIHAQCLAYCALGICPQTAQTTAHPHCPHHPGNGPANGNMPPHGAAHNCMPHEAFFVKSLPEIAALHAIRMTMAPADAFAAPAAALFQPGIEAGPPLAAPPPSLFVRRI